MQLVLDIDEQQKDTILNIIQNLKEGLVKRYTIRTHSPMSDIPVVSPEEEDEIRTMLSEMSEDERTIVSTSSYQIEL